VVSVAGVHVVEFGSYIMMLSRNVLTANRITGRNVQGANKKSGEQSINRPTCVSL